MKLSRTTEVPPGGWRYVQNDNRGAFLKKFTGYGDYGGFIEEVLDFRKANVLNGSTTQAVDRDIQTYMCREVGNDPRYCTDESKKNSTLQRLVSRAKAAKHVVERLSSGAGIIHDWLGNDAHPVPLSTAQARSDVCSGRLSGVACPHNSDKTTASWFTGPVSRAIKEQVAAKEKLSLKVEGESALHYCQLCLCPLPLKVWVPMPTILNHFPDKMLDVFRKEAPANCWLLTETSTPTP